jgi:hypothetical protein
MHEGLLEECRANLEQREADLTESIMRMGKEALRRKRIGDLSGARSKMIERQRGLKRLERLRSSLTLVDTQLDALRTTELDKELMQTLLASSAALRKAGIGKGVKEAEQVMSELEEQLKESSELTSVLAAGVWRDEDLDAELEEEWQALESEAASGTESTGRKARAHVTTPPEAVNNTQPPPRAQEPVSESSISPRSLPERPILQQEE